MSAKSQFISEDMGWDRHSNAVLHFWKRFSLPHFQILSLGVSHKFRRHVLWVPRGPTRLCLKRRIKTVANESNFAKNLRPQRNRECRRNFSNIRLQNIKHRRLFYFYFRFGSLPAVMALRVKSFAINYRSLSRLPRRTPPQRTGCPPW
jgi:hypothetical protein